MGWDSDANRERADSVERAPIEELFAFRFEANNATCDGVELHTNGSTVHLAIIVGVDVGGDEHVEEVLNHVLGYGEFRIFGNEVNSFHQLVLPNSTTDEAIFELHGIAFTGDVSQDLSHVGRHIEDEVFGHGDSHLEDIAWAASHELTIGNRGVFESNDWLAGEVVKGIGLHVVIALGTLEVTFHVHDFTDVHVHGELCAINHDVNEFNEEYNGAFKQSVCYFCIGINELLKLAEEAGELVVETIFAVAVGGAGVRVAINIDGFAFVAALADFHVDNLLCFAGSYGANALLLAGAFEASKALFAVVTGATATVSATHQTFAIGDAFRADTSVAVTVHALAARAATAILATNGLATSGHTFANVGGAARLTFFTFAAGTLLDVATLGIGTNGCAVEGIIDARILSAGRACGTFATGAAVNFATLGGVARSKAFVRDCGGANVVLSTSLVLAARRTTVAAVKLAAIFVGTNGDAIGVVTIAVTTTTVQTDGARHGRRQKQPKH